jgi:hypothetical protein
VKRSAFALAIGTVLALLVASAAGAAGLLAPFDSPLPGPTQAQAIMSPGGTIVFLDSATVASGKSAVRVALRPPGGPIGPVAQLPPGGAPSAGFVTGSAAMGAGGDLFVTWTDAGTVFYARRSPAGVWGSPTAVTASANAGHSTVGVDGQGTSTIEWSESMPSGMFTTSSVRVVRVSPNGAQSTADLLAGPTSSTSSAYSASGIMVLASGRALASYSTTPTFDRTQLVRDTPAGTFAAIPVSNARAFLGTDGTVVLYYTAAQNAIRVRSPSGALGPEIPVSAPSTSFITGVSGDGTPTALWIEGKSVLACRVDASGCVGQPQTLTTVPGSDSVTGLEVAYSASGTTLATWIHSLSGSQFQMETASRVGPTGAFGPVVVGSDPPSFTGVPSLDDAGDGIITRWKTALGPQDFRGFDAVAPALSGFTAPASLRPGANGGFSAAATDVWGPLTAGWDFGDGQTAPGATVAHAYAAPGSFAAKVTVTDAAGNAVSRSATVTVPGPPDTVRPVVSAIGVTHSSFRVGSAPTAISAAKSKRAPVGTRFRYSVSEKATATFKIERVASGRRSGKRCVAQTRKNRKARRCTRYLKRGTLTRKAQKGANSLAFSGRIGRKALATGSYRVTLTARDAARNVSRARTLKFKIVK